MVRELLGGVAVSALTGLACLVAIGWPGGTVAVPPAGDRAVRPAGTSTHPYWTSYRMRHAIPMSAARPTRAARTTRTTRWLPHGQLARYIGKVFFQLDGGDYVCSGAAVRSPGADVVVTAAHCISDGLGGYATNWTFVPGYHNGHAPYGSYSPRMFYLPGKWAGGRDEGYDFAFVTLNRQKTGTTSGDAGLPIGFNQPPVQVHVFGYPALPPFDGMRLRYCAGHGTRGAEGITSLPCGMTAGDSGGPWLTHFDAAAGTGTVVAVTSFRFGNSRTLHGSGMNQVARTLYARALAAS